MAKVVLFSTTTCSWCRRAKKYFKENRVSFNEVNIERDASAARTIQKKTGPDGCAGHKDRQQVDRRLRPVRYRARVESRRVTTKVSRRTWLLWQQPTLLRRIDTTETFGRV